MQVILLERVEKLGQMGDEVKVKDGFARNYLLPKKKALRANKTNREFFQGQKAQLEARNLEQKKEAEAVGKKLDGKTFMLIRQAGDRGQLYGSVSTRDIATAISEGGVSVNRTQVPLDTAIKTIGLFKVGVRLHPEVRVSVTINVARSEDEAERQARGEDVLAEKTEAEEAKIAAEELFEEGAAPKPDGEEDTAEAE
ncbi:MAG TPA: 50S ribosomal protein L9 [Rhizomicrobium sp.]